MEALKNIPVVNLILNNRDIFVSCEQVCSVKS